MKYDLIISDFDGTLGIAPGNIDEETVKTVKEYVKAGGKFVICTGRMFYSIQNVCKKYGIDGICIAYQGAMINEINSGKSLFMGGIEPELAAEITEKLLAENVQVIVDIDDVLYYQEYSPYVECI